MKESDIKKIFTTIEQNGFYIETGLSSTELNRIEKEANVAFPKDFRQLLQAGVPAGTSVPPEDVIGGRSKFPDYKNDAVGEINRFREMVKESFKFDIEHNDDFWMEEFGERPTNTEDAVSKALAILDTIPPLLPVFGHRCIPSSPSDAGNPVFSFWQPLDTIIYGSNLEEYFKVEFSGKAHKRIKYQDIKQVPFWSKLLEL
jgi:hypothetical protein